MSDLPVKMATDIANIASPQVPQLFQRAMPPQTPKVEIKGGFVGDALKNWKLARMEKGAQHELAIAKYSNQTMNTIFDGIKRAATFSDEMKNEFHRLDCERQMRDAQLLLTQEQTTELQLKNNLLRFELANAELEYNAKKKEMD